MCYSIACGTHLDLGVLVLGACILAHALDLFALERRKCICPFGHCLKVRIHLGHHLRCGRWLQPPVRLGH